MRGHERQSAGTLSRNRRAATNLGWDGLTQQDADNGYELWADPDATTLHCRDHLTRSAYMSGASVYMRPTPTESECRALLEWQFGAEFHLFDDPNLPYGCVSTSFQGMGWNAYNGRTGDSEFYCKYPQPATMPLSLYSATEGPWFFGLYATLINAEFSHESDDSYAHYRTLDECGALPIHKQLQDFVDACTPADDPNFVNAQKASCSNGGGLVETDVPTYADSGGGQVLPVRRAFRLRSKQPDSDRCAVWV